RVHRDRSFLYVMHTRQPIYTLFPYTTLFRSFLDANYFNKRFYFNNEVADLPKVKITFSNNYTKGKLFIENININKDISDVNISFALGVFVVDRSYLSNDENYLVFEIYDSNVVQQYKFNDIDDLCTQTSELDDYTLQIDKSIEIPLHGTLLV